MTPATARPGAGWLAWCSGRRVDVLAATRVHVDLFARAQLDAGAATSSCTRRLSALSSFYRYWPSSSWCPATRRPGCRPRPHHYCGPDPRPGTRADPSDRMLFPELLAAAWHARGYHLQLAALSAAELASMARKGTEAFE